MTTELWVLDKKDVVRLFCRICGVPWNEQYLGAKHRVGTGCEAVRVLVVQR